MEIDRRIEEWLKEAIEKEKPIELISFFEELPVRVKVKPLSMEKEFIQWESHPKLKLAVSDFGRIYTHFLDPAYGKKRVLAADVTYHSDSMIESTKFKPFDEPRFSREFPRVTVSEKLPVKLLVNSGKDKKTIYKVRDISENGIGFVSSKGEFSLNQKINLEVELPFGSFQAEGEVRSIEPLENKEKVGVKFLNLNNRFRNLLHRYVVERQREVLDRIRLLSE